MKKIKLGDIVKFDNEYGLVIDKVKVLGETRNVNVFIIGEKNHGERLKSLDVNDIEFVAHSYDFDNLRRALPKKIALMLKH